MRYILVIGVLVVCMIVLAYTFSGNPHKFSGAECRECHIDPERNPSLLTAPITKLCIRCHRRTIRASSHPVDIIPRLAKIPKDLPLADGGKITCNTCHDIHAEATLVFGVESHFLRRPTADMKFFCIACHEENRLDPGHRELVTLAHMGSHYAVTDPSSLLDPLSIECLGCHDSTIAGVAEYTIGGGLWTHEGGVSHPIGIHYISARSQNKALANPKELDRKLRFFAGKIGCGTCHDMYSTLTARLIMDNEGSRLCIACHSDK